MKFSVNKERFISALSMADSIINPKSPLSILINVYIEAFDNSTLNIIAFNGESGIMINVDCNIETTGKFLTVSKKLLEAVKKLPSENIIFEIDEEEENKVVITPEGKKTTKIKLNTISIDTFPLFSKYNWKSYYKISQENLKELIDYTGYSVSTDLTRVAFTGTYIEESENNSITFVTTDGKRLSVLSREYIEKVGNVELGIIVPEKILKTIHSVLKQGEVIFSVSGNQIFFELENIYLFSTLTEGKFPNYKEVIPKTEDNVMIIDTDSFIQAIDIVSTTSDLESCKIKAKIEDNVLEIESSHQIYGSSKAELDIEYKGEPITFAFNYRSFLDFLKTTTGTKVKVVINKPTNPILFKPLTDNTYIYVTMPMKYTE